MANNQYLEVTQALIDNALANCSNRCAVADAIRAKFPRAQRIRVDLATIRWTDPVKQERYVYLTPARAQEYIIAFDAGDPIRPFRFRLDYQGRQVIPVNPMPAEVQVKLHKDRKDRTKSLTAGKVGGKAPPLLGPSTARGFGICGLRINAGKVSINRDVDDAGGDGNE